MGGRSPTLGSLICTKKNYWTHFYVKNCAMSSQRTAWIIFSLGRVIMDYVLYFLKKKTKNGLDANDNIIRLSFVYGKLSYAMFYRHKVHEGLVSTIITLLKRILLKTIKHVRSKKLALARFFHNLTQKTCRDTCVTDTGAIVSYGNMLLIWMPWYLTEKAGSDVFYRVAYLYCALTYFLEKIWVLLSLDFRAKYTYTGT